MTILARSRSVVIFKPCSNEGMAPEMKMFAAMLPPKLAMLQTHRNRMSGTVNGELGLTSLRTVWALSTGLYLNS